MYDVQVSAHLTRLIADEFGPERSPTGGPAEWDFWSGPLAAALIAFRDFDNLRPDLVPQIRSYDFVDPVFGPIVFVGILVAPNTVELEAFAHDPDYWDLIDGDPDN